MPRVAFQVTIEVDPAVEETWDDWHSSVHIPELLAQPGFIGATKYRDDTPADDGWARYVCRYDLVGRDALDAYFSGPSANIRASYRLRFGKTTRVSRQVLVETGRFAPAR